MSVLRAAGEQPAPAPSEELVTALCKAGPENIQRVKQSKQHTKKEGYNTQIHFSPQEFQDVQTGGWQHLPQDPCTSPSRIGPGRRSQPPASAELLLQGEHKDCCPDRTHGHTPSMSPCTTQSASTISHANAPDQSAYCKATTKREKTGESEESCRE